MFRQQTSPDLSIGSYELKPSDVFKDVATKSDYVALRGIIELSDGVYGESRNRVLESLQAFLGRSLVGVGDLVCDGL